MAAYEALSTTAGLTKEDWHSAVEIMLKRSPDSLIGRIEKALQEAFEKLKSTARSRRTVVQPYSLLADDEDRMNNIFPEYSLSHTHFEYAADSFSAAALYMAFEHTYITVGYVVGTLLVYGGDISSQIAKGRDHMHFVADTSDVFKIAALQHQTRQIVARTMAHSTSVTTRQLCQRVIQRPQEFLSYFGCCQLTAETIIVDHARMNLTLKDVAKLGRLHKSDMIYGYYIFHPRMLLTDGEFTLPTLRARVRINKEKNTIKIFFFYSPSRTIEMSYSDYLALATTQFVQTADGGYVVEQREKRADIWFYRMIYVGGYSYPQTRLGHSLWFDYAEPMVVVTMYKLRSSYASVSKISSYHKYEFLAPEYLVSRGIAYGSSFGTGLQREKVLEYITSLNGRVLLGDSSVIIRQRIPAEELDALATAIFMHCFCTNFELGCLVEKYMRDHKKVAMVSNLRLVSLVARTLLACGNLMYRATFGQVTTYIRDKLVSVWKQYDDLFALAPGIKDVVRFQSYRTVVEEFVASMPVKIATDDVPRYYRLGKYATYYPVPELPDTIVDVSNVLRKSQSLPQEITECYVTVNESTDLTPLAQVMANRQFYVRLDSLVSTQELSEKLLALRDKIIQDNENYPLNTFKTQVVEEVEPHDLAPPPVPVPRVGNPLVVLQEYQDKVYPGVSQFAPIDDTSQTNYEDQILNASIEDCAIDTSRGSVPKSKYVKYSKLRTGGAALNQQTQRATTSALAKRNWTVFNVTEPQDMTAMFLRAWNKFLDRMCVPNARELLREFQRNLVRPNDANVSEWLRKLCTITSIEDIETFNYAFTELEKHSLMIKAESKPRCDTSILASTSKPQTVVYQEKKINAIYSPCFCEISKRLQSILLPNVMIYMRKNPSDIGKFVTEFGVGADFTSFIEVDHTSYDKQQQAILVMELMVYEALGMEIELLDWWRNGDVIVCMESVLVGIRNFCVWQRQSGDPNTALGNTVLNVLSFVDCINVDQFRFFAAMGDDSVMATDQAVDMVEVQQRFSDDYNLSAKALLNTHGYFCGGFLVRDTSLGSEHIKVHYMRDPMRRLENLGKYLPKSNTGEDEVHEQFVSFNDMLSNYDDIIALQLLDIVVCDRYKLDFSVYPMLCAMNTIAQDESKFREIYEQDFRITTY